MVAILIDNYVKLLHLETTGILWRLEPCLGFICMVHVYVILTKWIMLYFFLLRDGNNRQFGFVGYRTEGEAEEAVKYFNNSYLDSSRVVCEVCVPKLNPESLCKTASFNSTTLLLQHQNRRDKNKKTKALFGICLCFCLSYSITHQMIDQQAAIKEN